MVKSILLLVLLMVVTITFLPGIWRSWPKKNKKSSASKLVATTMTKVENAVDKLNENLRTPEVVEKEVKENLDLIYSQKADEFESLLNTISASVRSAEDSISFMRTSKSRLKEKMENLKSQVRHGECPKEEAVPIIAASMASIENLDKMTKSTEDKVKMLQKQKQKVLMQSELFVSRFNIARTDILTKIAQLKLNRAMNITSGASINISSIMDSLNVKIEKEENANAINETFFKGNINETADFSLDMKPSEEMRKKAEEYLK